VARVELGVAGFDFALNPDTGGLAVVVPDEDRVVLYPTFAATKGKAEPVAAKVGRLPVAFAFKRVGEKAYFVVACRDAAEVAVLDAVTLKPVKAIPLNGPAPVAVARSGNPKDPFAYYYLAVTGGSRTTILSVPDLRPAALAGRVPPG
jgi:hypothetical protein